MFPLVVPNASARTAGELTPARAKKLGNALHARICSSAYADALRVRPRKGSAILFYNLLPTAALDPLSVHGSCAVGAGEVKVGCRARQWISIFGNFSGHADGERRGLDRIGG